MEISTSVTVVVNNPADIVVNATVIGVGIWVREHKSFCQSKGLRRRRTRGHRGILLFQSLSPASISHKWKTVSPAPRCGSKPTVLLLRGSVGAAAAGLVGCTRLPHSWRSPCRLYVHLCCLQVVATPQYLKRHFGGTRINISLSVISLFLSIFAKKSPAAHYCLVYCHRYAHTKIMAHSSNIRNMTYRILLCESEQVAALMHTDTFQTFSESFCPHWLRSVKKTLHFISVHMRFTCLVHVSANRPKQEYILTRLKNYLLRCREIVQTQQGGKTLHL